jgi:hypothetical protein
MTACARRTGGYFDGYLQAYAVRFADFLLQDLCLEEGPMCACGSLQAYGLLSMHAAVLSLAGSGGV